MSCIEYLAMGMWMHGVNSRTKEESRSGHNRVGGRLVGNYVLDFQRGYLEILSDIACLLRRQVFNLPLDHVGAL